MSNSGQKLSRRHFLATGSAALTVAAIPGLARRTYAQTQLAKTSNKLNIAMIGAGGKGQENLKGVSSENIVALCDVDENRAAEAFKTYPQAKRYQDFRQLLEKEKNIDAVVVTTPDHLHAHASIMAMRLGKHVYCEKPLTHSVYEARLMRKIAAEKKVATQMGNQGHSFAGTRKAVEWLQAGVLGEVREVHIWTDRPIWPQGIARPADRPPVPPQIQWDLWLGPAPERPYHSAYLPFNWRGWWDFGTGALGDMACHCADTAYWGLNLGFPNAIEAESSGVFSETAPQWSIIRYQFPARGALSPVQLTWYDGKKKPAADLAHGEPLPDNGSLIIGRKGTMFLRDWNAENFILLPKAKFEGFAGPAPFLPRSPGHYQEWIAACKGGTPALSNFDYASALTETVLLGNVALRAGKKIQWNADLMTAANAPEAAGYIRREYRRGWELA